jgi:hypothetical protein
VTVKIGQQRQEQETMLAAFVQNTLIALLVIYALIAVPFKSYKKPLIFSAGCAGGLVWCGIGALGVWLAAVDGILGRYDCRQWRGGQ